MIQLEKLGYFLPQGYLFEQVSLQVNRGDKIGLVGKNGAGKSTLLKIMASEQEPDSGTISTPADFTVGYLPQDMDFISGNTVIDALLMGLEKIKKADESKFLNKFKSIDFNKKIILVTCHRRENFGKPFEETKCSLLWRLLVPTLCASKGTLWTGSLENYGSQELR